MDVCVCAFNMFFFFGPGHIWRQKRTLTGSSTWRKRELSCPYTICYSSDDDDFDHGHRSHRIARSRTKPPTPAVMNFSWLGSARKRQAKDSAESSDDGGASALGQSAPMADGKPLSLLRYDAESKMFEIGMEAIRTLESIPGPVGVIAVCGRARQGKSFILNQLLGKMGGFQVGPSVRPCTKGLWMWSKPLPLKSPVTGSTFHVVLLDSEGIDATDQTGTYSTAIFSLGILLSSLFVYNQMGGIDESALDKLSLVTQMTRHIQVRAGDNEVCETSKQT